MRIFRVADAKGVNINNNPEFVHRRILSPMSGGPDSVDVGFNNYSGGHRYQGPYAYNTDEFCYMAEGVADGQSHGVPFVCSKGTFLFRQAGAQTDYFDIPDKIVNICAFAPARQDMDGHRLTPDQFAAWNGSPGPLRLPVVFDPADITPSPYLPAEDQTGIVFRQVIGPEQGSHHCRVGLLEIAAGITVNVSPASGEEIWWVEEGTMNVTEDGSSDELSAHDCLYVGPQDATVCVKVLEDVRVVWLSPIR